jgi:hypothetical protein
MKNTVKYYLFLDESGDHGLGNIDPTFPVFVLSGILISEENYEILHKQFNQLKNKHWGEKKVILHSRDIRKCEKEFQILFNLDIKKDFYDTLNQIIAVVDYTIIAASINKEQHTKMYGRIADDVYEIALSFVIERTIFCLDGLKDKDKVLNIIIEKRGKKEDKKLSEHFQKIQSRGTGYVDSARLKSYNIDVDFKDKKDNDNGLQLADLVAYPYRKIYIGRRKSQSGI